MRKVWSKILRHWPNKTKVFIIGWHKTGTSSLGKALTILHYKVHGPATGLETAECLQRGEIDKVLNKLRGYDACQDMPWPTLYPQLHQKFPTAKFILMIREEESWLNSISSWKNSRYSELDEVIYGSGTILGNQEIYLERYRKHNEDVLNFFRNKPNQLLVLDLKAGDGWDELCAFLRKKKPSVPFPHINKSKEQ